MGTFTVPSMGFYTVTFQDLRCKTSNLLTDTLEVIKGKKVTTLQTNESFHNRTNHVNELFRVGSRTTPNEERDTFPPVKDSRINTFHVTYTDRTLEVTGNEPTRQVPEQSVQVTVVGKRGLSLP